MLQTLKHWLLAARPKTLTLALTPIITGTALGWLQSGHLSLIIMLVALLVALLIQIATNLHNDAADYESGTDQPHTRLGPARAVAQGWLSARQVEYVARAIFLLSFLIGLYLVSVVGWPILALGVLSIAGGYFYSSGP